MGRSLFPTLQPDTMKLSRLCSDALFHLGTLGRSKHTIASYEVAFDQFRRHVTERLGLPDEAKHFTDSACSSFMDALHQAGANPNMIRLRLSALAGLAKYGATQRDGRGRRVVAENPMAGLERPRRRKPAEKFLTPAELRAFLAVPLPYEQAVARAVLMDTGLRRAELCGANVGDLAEVEGHALLTVRVKGGSATTVPLSPAIAQLVQGWLIHRGMPAPEDPLFMQARGRERLTPSSLCHLTLRIARQAGITRLKVTPHVVRHTLELVRRQAGIDPSIRSRLLTHSSYASLGFYQHVQPQELAAARAQQEQGLRRYLGPDYVPDYLQGQSDRSATPRKSSKGRYA